MTNTNPISNSNHTTPVNFSQNNSNAGDKSPKVKIFNQNIPNGLLSLPITGNEFKFLTVFIQRLNLGDLNSEKQMARYESIETWMQYCQLSEKTVQKCKQRIATLSLIKFEKRFDRRGRSSDLIIVTDHFKDLLREWRTEKWRGQIKHPGYVASKKSNKNKHRKNYRQVTAKNAGKLNTPNELNNNILTTDITNTYVPGHVSEKVVLKTNEIFDRFQDDFGPDDENTSQTVSDQQAEPSYHQPELFGSDRQSVDEGAIRVTEPTSNNSPEISDEDEFIKNANQIYDGNFQEPTIEPGKNYQDPDFPVFKDVPTETKNIFNLFKKLKKWKTVIGVTQFEELRQEKDVSYDHLNTVFDLIKYDPAAKFFLESMRGIFTLKNHKSMIIQKAKNYYKNLHALNRDLMRGKDGERQMAAFLDKEAKRIGTTVAELIQSANKVKI